MNPNKKNYIDALKNTAQKAVGIYSTVNSGFGGSPLLGMANKAFNKPNTTVAQSNPSATSPISVTQTPPGTAGSTPLTTTATPTVPSIPAMATSVKTSGLPAQPAKLSAQQAYDEAQIAYGKGQNAIYDRVQALEFQPGQMESLKRAEGGKLQALEMAANREERERKEAEERRRWEAEMSLKRQTASGSSGDLFGGAKLSTGQKQDIADMLVLQRQIGDLRGLKGESGYVGAGPLSGIVNQPLASLTGSVRPGAQDVRNNIGQIKGFIAKIRGGTSFTPNEERLLETYTPKVGDSDNVLESKLKSLDKFINDKIETTVMVSGGNYNAQTPSTNQSSSTGTTPSGIKYTIE